MVKDENVWWQHTSCGSTAFRDQRPRRIQILIEMGSSQINLTKIIKNKSFLFKWFVIFLNKVLNLSTVSIKYKC